MTGIVGQFFRQFGLTIVAAVLMSLFVAFTLDPMLSSRFSKPHVRTARRIRSPRSKRPFVAVFAAIESLYRASSAGRCVTSSSSACSRSRRSSAWCTSPRLMGNEFVNRRTAGSSSSTSSSRRARRSSETARLTLRRREGDPRRTSASSRCSRRSARTATSNKAKLARRHRAEGRADGGAQRRSRTVARKAASEASPARRWPSPIRRSSRARRPRRRSWCRCARPTYEELAPLAQQVREGDEGDPRA